MATVNANIPDNIVRVAKQTVGKYSDYVSVEDIIQQLHLYVLENEKMFTKWAERKQEPWAIRALHSAAKKFCETEKAHQSGYSVDDVYWYEPAQLANLIPLALNAGWDGLSGADEDRGMPQGKSPASEGGNLIAMVADIRRVLRGKKFLLTDFDIETDEGAERLQWLCYQLGGEYPTTPGHFQPGRKAMSNATAIAMTEAQ